MFVITFKKNNLLFFNICVVNIQNKVTIPKGDNYVKPKTFDVDLSLTGMVFR